MPAAEAEPWIGFKPRRLLFLSANAKGQLLRALLQPSYKQQSVSLLIDPKMQLFCFFEDGGRRGRGSSAMQAFPDLAEEAVFCPTKHLLLPVT
jgi:hypothetical protein